MDQAPRTKKGFKLSAIISCVVLLSVFVTIVITTFVGFQAERSSLAINTLELNRINASDMSKTTESLVQSMKKSMMVTAEYFSEVTLTDDNVLSQLDYFMNTNHYFNSIVIVNADGTVVSTSPNTLGLIGEKLTSDAAQEALEVKAPLISEPFSAVTKRLIVLVSHPIFDSAGNYKGFVGGSIYLQQPNIFQEILGTQSKNNNGSYFYVVDASGTLIYHPDTNRIAQKVTRNPVVQQLMNGTSGEQQVINSNGISYLAGYAVVHEVGWGIVSQTPVSYIDARTVKLIQKIVLVSLPYLFILLVMTLWISRKLTYPLNRLANYASQLSQGDQQLQTIPVQTYWNYETNELTKTIALAFDRMKKKTDELSQEAQTDALTGLANRRTMLDITSQWNAREIPFSIIMMDLDRFKLVNDTYGHQKGDEVLRFLAQMMAEVKRDQDICCRFGGEEFTMLLPETSEEEAFVVAERLRIRMETAISPIGRPVTLSLGISMHSHASEDLDTVLQHADEALYAAKEQGRNQTVMYNTLHSQIEKTIIK